ncbi:MAG TPA: SpoIID/LytB domain-containing protein [Candidatus Babeliaceae bacterium]|nr:SpoIID/LytB domain-containing protein [Candidatus Babeliaceae bacterium]
MARSFQYIFFLFTISVCSANVFGLKVRVLLDEISLEQDYSFSFQCIDRVNKDEKPYFALQGLDLALPVRVGLIEKALDISLKSGRLYSNGKALKSQSIKIEAIRGYIGYKGNIFEGCFIVTYDGQTLRLINMLDLESYVTSVVRWESIPTWPLAVNEAAAIACRSYVFSLLYSKRKTGQPYDIKATNLHQTYKGIHNFKQVEQAVRNTEGLILAYNKKPIVAMYDVCCGGIIPAYLEGIDFTKAPYLARDYPCHYCKDSKVFSWKVEYDLDHIQQLLTGDLGRKAMVKDIRVSQTDKAGAVQEVSYKVGNTWKTVSGKKLYNLCKEIKSFCFSVNKKLKKVHFGGYGWGHHLGMCQWGARQMAKEGCDCKTILRFYYPKASLMKVITSTKDKGCLNIKNIS